MYLITRSDGICLASPAIVPRLLLTFRGWPRGPSLKAPFSYEVVSPFDPGFTQVVLHMVSLLKVVQGQARSHNRNLGRTSTAMTCEIHYVPSEAPVVVLIDMLLPQLFA